MDHVIYFNSLYFWAYESHRLERYKMAYQPNIPLPGDLLSQSQADINGNFTALGNMLNVNAGTLAGTLILPQITAPTLTGNQVGLYNSGTGTANALSVIVGTNAPIDFTTAGKTNPGWCRLPCGIKLLWFDVLSVTGGTAYPITTGGGFPVFTTIYSVQVTTVFKAIPLTYPVCYTSTGGTSPNFTITLDTKNGAGDAGAKIFIIGI